jgi:hypothetical protein
MKKVTDKLTLPQCSKCSRQQYRLYNQHLHLPGDKRIQWPENLLGELNCFE